MEANADKTVRFYGNSYTENGSQLGQITLVQNNNQQPWSSSDGGGLKFTHKENMGWNLFGSPYLCAMNYSDMEYGRVIYQCEENGSYKAINTMILHGVINGWLHPSNGCRVYPDCHSGEFRKRDSKRILKQRRQPPIKQPEPSTSPSRRTTEQAEPATALL